MNKVIILLGQRVRSGTNFIGSTLAMHPDVVTLPPNVSLGEFNLFSDRAIIDKVFKKVSKKSFGLEISKKHESDFIKAYGENWLHLLKQRFNIPNGKTIFIKSPVIDNVDLWKNAFPESQIALICRDGRDNVISSVKASNDNRSWHNLSIKIKKKLNFFLGRTFISNTKHWVKTAKKYFDIIEDNKVKKFKYEDLINSENNIKELLKHYDLSHDKIIVQKCLNAPVVGSSFGVNTKSMSKPNWEPDTDKSKYVFTNKWVNWGFVKKTIFKSIAGKSLVDLGYEKNTNW